MDVDEILLFTRLPKRIKKDGSIGVDKQMLRDLLDIDKEHKLFDKKQDIFDFKEMMKHLQSIKI